MANNKGLMLLVGLGAVVTGLFLWLGKKATVTFTVLLENLPPSIGLTVWDAYWWDGVRLVPNKVGLTRPVTEAALFQDVSSVPGSFVLASVTINGVPVEQAAMLPNPVNFAGYAFDWSTRTLRLL